MDEANPVPADRNNYTITITDSVTKQPVMLVLKSPKGESNTRKSMIGKSLEDIIGVHSGGPHGRRKDDLGHTVENYQRFADFIHAMLEYQPDKRVSASDALSHDYVLDSIDFPVVGGTTSNTASSKEEKVKQENEMSKDNDKDKVAASTRSCVIPPALCPRRSSSAPRLSSNVSLLTSTSTTATSTNQVDSGKQDMECGDDSVQVTASLGAETVTATSKGDQALVLDINEGPMETSEVDDEGNVNAS